MEKNSQARSLRFCHYWPETGVMSAGHDILTIVKTSDGKTLDKAIWLQFTGQLDMFKKEIYEDNIVKIFEYRFNHDLKKWGLGNLQFIGQIYFRDDRWHCKNSAGDDYDNGDYYNGDEMNWIYIEIIGNIHQNPELLK